MEGLFDFVDTMVLLYERTFDLHRNGIYATLLEGKKINIITIIEVRPLSFLDFWAVQTFKAAAAAGPFEQLP